MLFKDSGFFEKVENSLKIDAKRIAKMTPRSASVTGSLARAPVMSAIVAIRYHSHWLPGWLPGWLSGWLSSWLVAWLAAWLAALLAA